MSLRVEAFLKKWSPSPQNPVCTCSGDFVCCPCAATEAIADLQTIRNKIETELNNYLCEMKPGYDDSIVGFNEAWDIIRKVFNEASGEVKT